MWLCSTVNVSVSLQEHNVMLLGEQSWQQSKAGSKAKLGAKQSWE